MKAKIQKLGNSAGIRIPSVLLKALNLKINDNINIEKIEDNVFNINTKLAILCPIASNEKFFPTHYILEDTKKLKAQYYVNT